MEHTDEKFHEIYRHYMPLLRLIASQKSIPYDDIDDMVQDTFILYYTHYPTTWQEYQIRSSLAKIMRNLCADYFRRRSSHPVIYVDSTILTIEGTFIGMLPGKNPLDIVMEHQEYEEILKVFKTMKEDWMAVFLLYFIEERPMREVSQILGISEAACRMRLMRGRQYLNEQLAKKT